jgi:hypothetical protein
MTRINAVLSRAAMPPFNMDQYAGSAAVGMVLGQQPPRGALKVARARLQQPGSAIAV